MKKIMVALLVLFCALPAAAQSPKDITEKFFKLYEQDPLKSLDFAFGTTKYIDPKSESIIDLKNKLKNLVDLCGKYSGYEVLDEVTAGQCLVATSYLVRYDRQPLRFRFLFYKASEKWVVQDFSFDTSLDDDLKAKLNGKVTGN